MIFECPHCSTTHSKPERDIGDGTDVICRKCSAPFWVNSGGKAFESAPAAAPVEQTSAVVTATEEPAPPQPASEFHLASTEVMAVSPNVAKKVADARKRRQETAAPAAPGATTEVNTKDEIRALLEESKPPAETRPLDLSVPEPLGQLEGSEPEAAASNGLDLPLSEEEERPDKPAKPVLTGPMPPFPRAALRDWLAATLTWLSAQKIAIKIAVAAAAGLAIVLVGIGLGWAFSSSDTQVAFVGAEETLVSGPGESGEYPQIATIERGEQVLVFDAGGVGDFVLVRDLMGRAGFIPRQSITRYRPSARSGVPFVGCRQSPIEETAAPCVDRAHLQFESCREICEEAGEEDMACLEQCQRQMDHCIERCEETAEESAAEPEPLLEEQTPGADPADAAKPKKKKRKKKKRRKR